MGLCGLIECSPSVVWSGGLSPHPHPRPVMDQGEGAAERERESERGHMCEHVTPLEAKGSPATSAWK